MVWDKGGLGIHDGIDHLQQFIGDIVGDQPFGFTLGHPATGG